MIIGIPKEVDEAEGRVAVTPRTAVRLRQLGVTVLCQRGAGERAEFDDQQYAEAGVRLVDDVVELFGTSDVILKVGEPAENRAVGRHEVDMMRPGTAHIGFIWPSQNGPLLT